MGDENQRLSFANALEKSLTILPTMRSGSPAVVLICDRIRFALNEREDFAEFCWFVREYPRCYRFHLDAAEFRLRSVHTLMRSLGIDLLREASESNSEMLECSVSNVRVQQVYWDFESYLSETCIALDMLARVVGPTFPKQSPPSFNKLCKWKESHALLNLFRDAQTKWVNRLKDYRDCFTHYTPVDTLVSVSLRRGPAGWELRAKLPTNPNVREILAFRFSGRIDALRYAVSVYRHMTAFDKAVAGALWALYRRGDFPARKDRLFFLGQRNARS